MMNRAVFLDRDGTLGGGGWYCHPDQFTLYHESIDAIRLFNQNHVKTIVITNQTHIGHGDITLDQVNHSFQRIQQELSERGAWLDAWYVCPHRGTDNCQCCKPNPYMLLQAARDHNIDLRNSYMVGDMGASDMKAGFAAGCRLILVLTGLGVGSLGDYRHEWADVEPDFVARNVLQAAKIIVDD